MQDSTIAFKNELLTFNLRDIEYNWIDVAPQIIEFSLPLPMFSNEEIREKRKDEKVLIVEIFYPTGHNQSYHTYLADLAEKIYHVELNNESDSRFLLQSLYEIKDKLTPAKDLSVKHLEGFKHDFEYYKDYSIKLLNGEYCENLLKHKFNKFTFWRQFMPIFGGHPLQEDNYFNHNFYFKDYETGDELPIFYVTEFFLKEIEMLIQNRLLIVNKLIVKIENRLGLKVASGGDDKKEIREVKKVELKRGFNFDCMSYGYEKSPINQYGERNEELCKMYEEKENYVEYQDFIKNIPIQDPTLFEGFLGGLSEPPKLKKPTLRNGDKLIVKNYNYWSSEKYDRVFNYFKERQGTPLTIKLIKAQCLYQFEESQIEGIIENLYQWYEIEYKLGQNSIGEVTYTIIPLENQLCKRTNEHFLKHKFRKEVIIEMVERVRSKCYNQYYQDAENEINGLIKENPYNLIDKIKEKYNTVEDKINNYIPSLYKVSDIDKLVERINNHNIEKHYSNDEKEDVKILEWELERMFKFQSWIDCGNNKLSELLSSPPVPKRIKQGKDEKKYSAPVIMAVAQIIDEIKINGIKVESFLPKDEADFEKRVELTIIAIFNKLGLTVGPGIRNHFKPDKKLTKTHKKKIVELLNSKGYTPQAKKFEMENIYTNR